MQKYIKPILTFIAVFYVGLGGILYFSQEKLLFIFKEHAEQYEYSLPAGAESITISAEDATLYGVLIQAGNQKSGHVAIYYRGNAGTITTSLDTAAFLNSLGYDVLLMDYRSNGKSRGALSEQALLSDALRWYDVAATRYGADSVLVVGYSMGTTFASHVAAQRDFKNLLLFAPPKSILDVASRTYPFMPVQWFLKYPLRSDLKLAASSVENILIYHGKKDRVVPFDSGRALYESLGARAFFYAHDTANHASILYAADVRSDITARYSIRPQEEGQNGL